MASESAAVGRLLSLMIGLATAQVPDSESGNRRVQDRIFLVDPTAQDVVMLDAENLDSLFQGLSAEKEGKSPASKESIDAMPTVAVTEIGRECAICLEEQVVGEESREMPCKHRFHSGCIEKWLGIHGSCPVCRYEMPVEEKEEEEGEDGERSGDSEIRVSVWRLGIARRSSDSGSHSDPATESNSESRADENGEVVVEEMSVEEEEEEGEGEDGERRSGDRQIRIRVWLSSASSSGSDRGSESNTESRADENGEVVDDGSSATAMDELD